VVGILQAVRRNKLTDHVLNTTSTIFYATPDFLIGIIGILAFAIAIPIFPPEGPQGEGVDAIITDFNALILPICCLSLTTIALFSRYMRSSVLDNLTEDYVRTARAKGAPESRVIRVHVLRNALLPVVTMLGMDIGLALGGAIFTETVYGLPGLGRTAVTSLNALDLPTVEGIVVFATLAIIVFNLIVDLLYAWIDPRIRLA
jgi:peptide/nickel transport system permease protein